MSFKARNAVEGLSQVQGLDYLVLREMADCADDLGYIENIATREIAGMLRLSRPQVRAAIRRLVASGELEIYRTPGYESSYYIALMERERGGTA